MSAETEILLCCLLWAHEGCGASLSAYEDGVLALLTEHGGEVVDRAKSDGKDGHPDEVQFYRFASPDALDSYLNEPRRQQQAAERDRVIARTELFPISFLPAV
ncbi:hypothetical protein [Brevibacterium sp. UCMA 11754]|uniref:hypothetical protein n=1 Tax=Brevibacterium sp. UCMA 11754 TaxID=2749198 RepID=UPI001F41CD8A|nr:hypothetical protein [Brevibacterium sp. UCMA 11754]MCF2573166.1 hypothetical protein [Brevibacterium sp. UCMA 11754]